MGTGAKAKKARKPRPRAPEKKRERLRPVSLHPLDFDEAMRGLLSSRQGETLGRDANGESEESSPCCGRESR